MDAPDAHDVSRDTSPTVTAAFRRHGAAGVLDLVHRHAGPIVEETADPDTRRITFVFADDTVDAELVRVVCAALPSKGMPLERLGSSPVFAATAELPATAFVGYSYVVDPPPELAFDDDAGFVQALVMGRPDPNNPFSDAVSLPQIRFGYEYSILALGDRWTLPPDGARMGPRGTLDDWVVSSDLLGNERMVRVYRPPAYDSAERCALVFILGGADEWWEPADGFDDIAARGAEPFLGVIVGTRGFVSRHRELAGNDAFVGFVARELLPFLADRYRVLERGHVVAGASVGAVGAAFLALREAETFSRAALVSATFQATPGSSPLPWRAATGDERPVLDEYERHHGRLPARVYISAGRFERYTRVDMHADAARLATLLANRGVDVRFDNGYTAHDTIALRAYLSAGIAWLLGVDA